MQLSNRIPKTSQYFLSSLVIISIFFTSSFSFAASNPTLTDLWNGQAKWVEEHYNIASTDGLFSFPSMYWEGNQIWAVTDIGQNGIGITGGIKKSVSTDGINWSNDTVLIRPGLKIRYEAEDSSHHLTGNATSDAWRVTVLDQTNTYMSYGPYATMPDSANMTAKFRMRVDNNTAGDIQLVRIEVYDSNSNTIKAYRDVRRHDFNSAWGYQDFDLTFDGDSSGLYEFRVFYYGYSLVDLDYVEVSEWDSEGITCSGIKKVGNTWYLVYEANPGVDGTPDIGLATSTNGITFTKYTNNPLMQNNPYGWEVYNIGTPSLDYIDGKWYLYYHGFGVKNGKNVCQLGVASGTNLYNLTKETNPIIPTAYGNGDWEAGTTGKRSRIFTEGNYRYMAYEGSEEMLPDSTFQPWRIGFARSAVSGSPTQWTKSALNPLVPAHRYGGYSGSVPEIIKINDVYYLYVWTIGYKNDRYKLVWK